jgi:AbiU2
VSYILDPIESLIEEYRNEVATATAAYFAQKALNNLAVDDDNIYRALNDFALSWRIVRQALQTTFFVTLGRIFDRDNRSLTLQSLLSRCKTNLDDFRRPALEARRIREAHGKRPEYLDNYLRNAYEPVVADFEAIERAAVPFENSYQAIYQPIRHKLIAHRDLATLKIRDDLFGATNIGEIEAILEFLHRVERVVAELHTNGRKTELRHYKITLNQRVTEDLAKMLKKLASKQSN